MLSQYFLISDSATAESTETCPRFEKLSQSGLLSFRSYRFNYQSDTPCHISYRNTFARRMRVCHAVGQNYGRNTVSTHNVAVAAPVGCNKFNRDPTKLRALHHVSSNSIIVTHMQPRHS